MQSVKEGRPRFVSLFLVILLPQRFIFPCIISPPSLMDDSDAVEAQIGRTMLTTHDWVTARLDGVVYLEKTPMSWWLMDIFYKVFGFKDWAARIPFALTAIGLAWLTGAFARWAFGGPSGFCAGFGDGNLRRPMALHAHPYTRCDADLCHHPCHVVFSASP